MKQLDVVVVQWQFLLTSIFVGVELSGESLIASLYQLHIFLVVSRLRHCFRPTGCVLVELSGKSPIASSYQLHFSLWCQDSGIDFHPLTPFNFLFLADLLGMCFMWTTGLVYIG
ncbi:hypothetical protein ACQJBY_015886 [Aegilops geniculata]